MAEVLYPLDGQLAPPSGSFGFLEANSVAVNDFNGDTYVADSDSLNGGPDVVDVFDSGRTQIANLNGASTPAGSFGGGAVAVAANNGTGEVYVLDSTDNVVDVFDATGAYRCQITGRSTPSASECNAPSSSATPAGGFNAASGITVDQATGDIYVVDVNNGVIDIFGAAGTYVRQISLASVPGGVTSRTSTSIAVDDFNGHVYVADSGPVLVYEFDAAGNYLATWTGSNTPEGPSLGRGYLSVAADNMNGTIYVTYTAHEVTDVFNSSGEYVEQFSSSYNDPRGTAVDQASGKIYVSDNEPSVVDILHREVTVGPRIREESITNVASTSATLDASINPNNAATSYYFQYGTSLSYGAEVPLAPGISIGFREGNVDVSQHVQGLSAGVTYHYRVVAASELKPGTVEMLDGPDQTFTTQAVGGGSILPDGRAWEMVSSPDKQGAQVFAIGQYGGEGAVIQAAAEGGAMTYITDAPTELEPKGYTNLLQVFSTRGSAEWASQDIAIPHDSATNASIGNGEEYRFFSEDLSFGVVQPFGAFMPSLSAEASEQTPYLRTDFAGGATGGPCASSCYRPLVTGAPGHGNTSTGVAFGEEGKCPPLLFCGPKFLGATSDASHVVIESPAALTSTLTGGINSLYEWSDGRLALVSELPGGGVASGAQLGFQNINVRHAISDDGSHVFWSAGHLYMRDTVKEKTVQLDTVQGGSGEGSEEPVFQIASSDGSKVFFTDRQRLTKDSGGQGGSSDLYECEIVEAAGEPECRLSDVTPSGSAGSADVLGGVLGASEDGSSVYFVANGVFAPGAVHGQCSGPTSADTSLCNLYMWHEGVISLVAVLAGADHPDWEVNLPNMTARVSPDGRWLAFMSQRGLTGYDTRDAVSGKPDEEVYLYSAEASAGSGHVACTSCDPTGARPIGVEYGKKGIFRDGIASGDRVWESGDWLAANIPGWTPYQLGAALYQSRYLSDDGRLFFNSSDALVSQDVNGTEDVYEYEPPGVGDCMSASVSFSSSSGGCVSLISPGTSSEESGFMDASSTGGDVFFLTAAKLAVQDRDTAVDIYDAHECSVGLPCFSPTFAQPPVCDTGDSCKAAPSPQPEVFGAPSSETFSGAGNVTGFLSKPVVQVRGLTKAQRLARALRACRRIGDKRRRSECKRRARARNAARQSSGNAIRKGGR
jgi:DNA-binding beta-propeller fold protein YncE